MVNTYTVLKSIHVVGAVMWVGSGFLLNVAITLAFTTDDRDSRLRSLKLAEFVGPKLLTPISIVVIGMGVWLAAKYDYFDLLWVRLGLASFVITFLVGIAFLGPQSAKMVEMIEGGSPDQEVMAKYRVVSTVARLDSLMLLAIVVIMVIKPT